MFITKLSAKLWHTGKTLIKNFSTKQKSVITANAQNSETCGLIIRTLEHDTVQIKNSVKQITNEIAAPVIPTAPAVFEGSQVSQHHFLHGYNIQWREAYEDATSGKILSERNTHRIKSILPLIYENDKEFAQLPSLEKKCIAWRGRSEHPFIKRLNKDFDIIESAKVGDIIVLDAGYSYWGFTKELASCWARPVEGRSMMFKGNFMQGAKVSRNLEHGGEVVTPRNSAYILLSKIKNGNHTDVELEYILPECDNVAEIEELMKRFGVNTAS